jgi:hydroxyacylglutathione hydrolase
MKIDIIPILKDNYAYLLRFDNGQNAIVDPGEAEPIIEFLDQYDLKLDLIINTHHHGDHTAGNKALKDKYACPIAAPSNEADQIGSVDIKLSENKNFEFADEVFRIIETPGHTRGHICLYHAPTQSLFSGDTLFSMGCGRLFEADAEAMWQSLQKLVALPQTTKIYCGHEYTQSNATFCKAIEPENPDLLSRIQDVESLRAQNKPSIPVSLETEMKTNVFLRAKNAAEFAALRQKKDSF